jgi:hypothetical protein
MFYKTGERGQALILIALAAIGLFAFSALAIDGTRQFSNKRNAQNAADTAVLAAALKQIRTGDFNQAVDAAEERAEDNGYIHNGVDTWVLVNRCSDQDKDLYTGALLTGPGGAAILVDCQGLPAAAQRSEYIRVRIVTTIPTTFGRVLGRDTMMSAAQAVARVTAGTSGGSGGGSGYGLTALKQGCVGGPGLSFTGSGDRSVQGGVSTNSCFSNTGSGDYDIDGNVEISYALDDSGSSSWDVGGNVWLNGYSKSGSGSWDVAGSFFSNAGFSTTGSAHYTFGSFTTVGAASKAGSASVTPWPGGAGTGTYQTPPVIQDPFASVLNPPPNPGSCQAPISYSGSTDHTLNPGCYNGISQGGSGDLTLNPGIYYFATGGISSSGSGDITANGVMIYLKQGGFGMNGSGDFTITPITSGPYKGLSVYMDRDNHSSYSMTGSGDSSFSGTIYAPSSAVTITGSGGTLVLDSQILCYTATLIGSGNLALNYTPSNNFNPPPAVQPEIRPIE